MITAIASPRPMDSTDATLSDRCVEDEERQLARAIAGLEPGEQAFVARQQRPYIKSVVLIGRRGGAWRHGVDCYYGDHQARAKLYAERLNKALP